MSLEFHRISVPPVIQCASFVPLICSCSRLPFKTKVLELFEKADWSSSSFWCFSQLM